MFCRNCGAKVPDSAAFCPSCGARTAPPKSRVKKGGSGKTVVIVVIAAILVLAAAAVIGNLLLGKSDVGKKPDMPVDQPAETDPPVPPAEPDDSTPDTAPDDTSPDPAGPEENQPQESQEPAVGAPSDPAGSELAKAKAAYAEVVRSLAAQDQTGELEFDLIDLTDSDIPELMVGKTGYYVSVYMWIGGKAALMIDTWPYGAAGNGGYEYLPGQNVIRNFNSDMAGAIVYESYMTIDPDYGVIPIWSDSLTTWWFRDLNGDYMPDEDEILEEPIYFYGDTELTAEEYKEYQIPGDYQWMDGGMPADEILAVLEK